MIDISDEEIVTQRTTRTGRFVLFCNTDLPKESVIPWWSVMMDIGGDGAAILVRLDESHGRHGFTALALIRIALARLEADIALRRSVLAEESLRHLGEALKAELRRRAGLPEVEPVHFESSSTAASPWLRAEFGDEVLTLTLDPAGHEEGSTLEQVLMVLDQLCLDAARVQSGDANLAVAAFHVGKALWLEGERAFFLARRRE